MARVKEIKDVTPPSLSLQGVSSYVVVTKMVNLGAHGRKGIGFGISNLHEGNADFYAQGGRTFERTASETNPLCT